MNEENTHINLEEPDSLAWGSAAKGTAKKVYGNLEKAPVVFGRKIERIKVAEKLALGEIDWPTYQKNIEELK